MKNKLSKKQNKKDPTAWSVMCGVFDFLVFLFENCRSKLAMKINPLLHEVETWLSLVHVITSTIYRKWDYRYRRYTSSPSTNQVCIKSST